MDTQVSLPLVAPRITPVLDPAFRPAVLAVRAFDALVAATPDPVTVRLALEQADGSTFRFDTRVLPAAHARAAANATHLERFVKFLLWSRGGWRLFVDGPPTLVAELAGYGADVVVIEPDVVRRRVMEHLQAVVGAPT